jgi:hypothetical protein
MKDGSVRRKRSPSPAIRRRSRHRRSAPPIRPDRNSQRGNEKESCFSGFFFIEKGQWKLTVFSLLYIIAYEMEAGDSAFLRGKKVKTEGRFEDRG